MFQKQTKNVQHLRKVIKQLNQDINESIQKSNTLKEDMRVNLLALAYSAWSEAQFIQIIYTPNAFTTNEINSMLKVKGIFDKWKKLINYSFDKIERYNFIEKEKSIQLLKDNNQTNQVGRLCQEFKEEKLLIQEKKNKLLLLLQKYIEEPSRIRNKIAHGQWIHPLDDSEIKNGLPNATLKEDINLKKKLNELNPISIMREFEVHTTLGKIIRKLIESQSKGFTEKYNLYMNELEKYLEKTESYTMDIKRERLRNKPSYITCKICKEKI
ncbi:MAG: Unknown protein [uncultured Sulfurovum sp.]|uniref:RiboL-PSP-HEPN domain-containing protein n=1 Tax=uncultured Sulfurovum sp. TaxID=269237 RepID=A0A6S6T164_9BACT|nr:MAG: Unknown protein [uncultured Sulfurovum sp.]